MSVAAAVTQYREEVIAAFEVEQSFFRDTVTTEAVIKGNQAVFLVSGSGDATATTRGVNGLIPARTDDNTQNTATLVEAHDLVQKTGFNIFASQGDQRRLMQRTSMGVINRDIDDHIITALNTSTLNNGSAATASLAYVAKARTILLNNKVPLDGQVFGAITPAFEAYMLQVGAFTSADYVNLKPLAMERSPKGYTFMGITWFVHPSLPGVGTNAEKCFLYHRNAIGHAVNKAGMDIKGGVNEEQDYSWARTSIFHGAKLLQNEGVLIMNHDGSAYVAA